MGLLEYHMWEMHSTLIHSLNTCLLNMFSLLNAMRLAIQQTFILSCNLQPNWSENHGAKEMFLTFQPYLLNT